MRAERQLSPVAVNIHTFDARNDSDGCVADGPRAIRFLRDDHGCEACSIGSNYCEEAAYESGASAVRRMHCCGQAGSVGICALPRS